MAFDKKSYVAEMKLMVDKAIERLKNELPEFKIYSVSIWTDPNAGASSINFDSKSNSEKVVEKANQYDQNKYDEFIAIGDKKMAKLFKPISGRRNTNPADFELRDYAEYNHQHMPSDWESISDGKCWKELKPSLLEIGKYAFEKIQVLALEENFELATNSDRDWYDKTWKLK
ncbi:MAG: hypothetical protein HYX40_13250 [Sphingobacteriales bacterium]|nr:hypothetical protein [Sphingobacteriales bacterium]